MICNNLKLDLVNMKTYIKFSEILSICSQDSMRKMTCINPKLDLVKMKAYIKLGENQSICSRDIERKRNFGANKGP